MLADVAQIIETIKPVHRPFHDIPIKDCGEKLIALRPMGLFAFEEPHAYTAAGAPYDGREPYSLRSGVAERLQAAQTELQARRTGWRIKVFDAYRPLAVQSYMVAYTFLEIAKETGKEPAQLSTEEKEKILAKVYRIWSPPNPNPVTPPPHSTGAAIDCTLIDDAGLDAEMGSPIDLNSDLSNPDFFAGRADELSREVHENRVLLFEAMRSAGFARHPAEWWHFSYGDQLWAWLKNNKSSAGTEALYGRVE